MAQDIIENLKSRFTTDQIKLAASIGHDDASFADLVVKLFESLNDPLITLDEIMTLLSIIKSKEEGLEIISKLVADDILEQTTTTQRPLDKEKDEVLYRLKSNKFERLKIYGVASQLSTESQEIRIQFTIDGRLIRSIARVDRLDAVSGKGQQRDEIVKHVKSISEGIKSGIQVPNSVILVFEEELWCWDPKDDEEDLPESTIICKPLADWREVPIAGSVTKIAQRVCPVELSLPFRNACFDDEKPALLVDGQQRTAALSLVDIDEVPSYFLAVNAVVSSAEDAKEVFRIANSNVRISTDFSRALLGTLNAATGFIKDEKRVAQAVKFISMDNVSSPFYKYVKHPGLKSTRAPIAYNTIFAVISIFDQSGMDFQDDPVKLAAVVDRAFGLVKNEWPDAWGKPTKESKLFHGAGLRAMAKVLIDKLKNLSSQFDHNLDNPKLWDELASTLKRLHSKVVWTLAEAEKGTSIQLKNYKVEIIQKQNTNQDIQALTTFLLKEVTYLEKNIKKIN